MKTIEQRLQDTFTELGMSIEQQHSVMVYLKLLKNKDEDTYCHSIRVGLKGVEVAGHFGIDPKILLYSGLLHDIGKALCESKTLKKTRGFSAKDRAEISKHPIDGYKLLTGIHDFTAEIVLRHHQYSDSAYPKKLPKSSVTFTNGSGVMIDFYSRLLSIIDFYDAIYSRDNDRFGSDDTKKDLFVDSNKDCASIIGKLYESKIFSEGT